MNRISMRGRGGRLLLLVFILSTMFLLTGCMEKQVSISTVITLDASGSGNRQMTLSMNKDVLSGSFGISIEDLENTLKEACPSGLTWSKSTDSSEYSYQFVLNFDSLKDYKTKVAEITGKKASISLETTEELLASGIHYTENFSSEDLFAWLTKALVDKKYLEADTQLFYDSSPEIHYGEEAFTSEGAKANVDNIQNSHASKVEVFTTYHENGLCDRVVKVYFSEAFVNANGVAIRTRMEARCPDGADYAWDIEDEQALSIYTGTGMDTKTLNKFMQSILGEEASMVHGETPVWSGSFKKTTDWNETLDVSLFTENREGKLSLGYYVQWDKDVVLSIRGKNEEKAVKLKKAEGKDKSGFYTVYEGSTKVRSFTTTFAVTYGISEINVDQVFKGESNVSRTIQFVFASAIPDTDLKGIYEKISDRSDEKKTKVSMTPVDETHSLPSITITESGGLHNLNQSFEELFGVEGQTKHELTKKLLELHHSGSYSDVMDFTGFLENDAAEAVLNYHVKFYGGETVEAEGLKSDLEDLEGSFTANGKEITGSVKGAFVKLSATTTALNTTGLALVGVLLGILLVLAVVKLLADYLRRLWSHVKEGGNVFQHAFDGRPEEDREILEQRFEESVNKKNDGKSLRNQLKEFGKSVTGKRTPAKASEPEDDYIDLELHDGTYEFADDILPDGSRAGNRDAQSWDPSELVEQVTESDLDI